MFITKYTSLWILKTEYKSQKMYFSSYTFNQIQLSPFTGVGTGRSLQQISESFAGISYTRVTSLQHTLNILINNMLTWLIISKKSKPLLVTAAVAQMSQNQNAFAMQGRGRPSLCTGTWRSQPEQAHPCLMGWAWNEFICFSTHGKGASDLENITSMHQLPCSTTVQLPSFSESRFSLQKLIP